MNTLGLIVGVISGAAGGAAGAWLSGWLPGRMEQQWRADAIEVLGINHEDAPPPPPSGEEGFSSPAWAWVLIGALFGALMGFGPAASWPALLSAALLLVGLTCGAAVDFRSHWLPDTITLPLLWAGLLQAALVGGDLSGRVLGAAAGYGVLFAVNQLYKLRSGADAIGGGDLKLLAAIGAWGGYAILPTVVIGGSVLGSLAGLALMIRGSHDSTTPLPFGPCLAAMGAIAVLGGAPVLGDYLHLMGGP